MENLKRLLPLEIYECVVKMRAEFLTELRLRVGKPLMIFDGSNWRKVLNQSGTGSYLCYKDDLIYILGVASGHSVYAVNDELIKGYLTYNGGIRIGVCGEGVLEGRELTAIKNFSSMTVRVPHQIFGCADSVIDIVNSDNFKNTLIVSPPSAGKTTMLREIARLTSISGKNVLVIDERFELTAPVNGVMTLDVGNSTDVICGVPKIIAYENTIRAMSPDVIITDEIYTKAEADSLLQAIRAGVKVAASIHADSVEALDKGGFQDLISAMQVLIVLSKKPKAGTVLKVIEC